MEETLERLLDFFDIEDENGVPGQIRFFGI